MDIENGRLLRCSSGEATVRIGDIFRSNGAEWEIVAFPNRSIYSPSEIGGTPIVTAKCRDRLPPSLQKHANPDNTVDWCGDSIAAMILDQTDGQKREARGYILRQPPLPGITGDAE